MTSNLSLNSFLNGIVAVTTTYFFPLEELGDLFNFLNHFPFVVFTGVEGTSFDPLEEEDSFEVDVEYADPVAPLEDEEDVLGEDPFFSGGFEDGAEVSFGGGLEDGSDDFFGGGLEEFSSFCFFATGLESSFTSSVSLCEAGLFFDLCCRKYESRIRQTIMQWK